MGRISRYGKMLIEMHRDNRMYEWRTINVAEPATPAVRAETSHAGPEYYAR